MMAVFRFYTISASPALSAGEAETSGRLRSRNGSLQAPEPECLGFPAKTGREAEIVSIKA